ncbi:MAG: hypothetical protein FVQ81_05065 [Candidatus Glassbacteria bacterium]|nr:hypothetical protein [Candidatus Glassbacteria bacterium]
MSDTHRENESKTTQQADKQSASSQQQKAEASAKAQQEYADKLKDAVNQAKEVEGALYTGVETVYCGVREMDAKITVKANELLSKLTGYLRESIESYKKAGKAK